MLDMSMTQGVSGPVQWRCVIVPLATRVCRARAVLLATPGQGWDCILVTVRLVSAMASLPPVTQRPGCARSVETSLVVTTVISVHRDM